MKELLMLVLMVQKNWKNFTFCFSKKITFVVFCLLSFSNYSHPNDEPLIISLIWRILGLVIGSNERAHRVESFDTSISSESHFLQ